MHRRIEPSFFLTNRIGAASGMMSILNSTCLSGGKPGSSSGKTSG
ncbi:hypothetical protein HanPI659440_Chr13g0487161 [Helianthus annuus]|nr:hypothetical protein HanPI659440_Chr13g0487161 [Helianthus annuus]